MTYTVKALLGTKLYTVTYEAGQLTGDEFAVDVLQINNQALQGTLIGPVGMYFDRDYLKNPLAALFLMREVFDEILELTGEVPEPPDVPDGAVI